MRDRHTVLLQHFHQLHRHLDTVPEIIHVDNLVPQHNLVARQFGGLVRDRQPNCHLLAVETRRCRQLLWLFHGLKLGHQLRQIHRHLNVRHHKLLAPAVVILQIVFSIQDLQFGQLQQTVADCGSRKIMLCCHQRREHHRNCHCVAEHAVDPQPHRVHLPFLLFGLSGFELFNGDNYQDVGLEKKVIDAKKLCVDICLGTRQAFVRYIHRDSM